MARGVVAQLPCAEAGGVDEDVSVRGGDAVDQRGRLAEGRGEVVGRRGDGDGGADEGPALGEDLGAEVQEVGWDVDGDGAEGGGVADAGRGGVRGVDGLDGGGGGGERGEGMHVRRPPDGVCRGVVPVVEGVVDF